MRDSSNGRRVGNYSLNCLLPNTAAGFLTLAYSCILHAPLGSPHTDVMFTVHSLQWTQWKSSLLIANEIFFRPTWQQQGSKGPGDSERKKAPLQCRSPIRRLWHVARVSSTQHTWVVLPTNVLFQEVIRCGGKGERKTTGSPNT